MIYNSQTLCYEVCMHYLIVPIWKVRERRVYRVMNLLKVTQLLEQIHTQRIWLQSPNSYPQFCTNCTGPSFPHMKRTKYQDWLQLEFCGSMTITGAYSLVVCVLGSDGDRHLSLKRNALGVYANVNHSIKSFVFTHSGYASLGNKSTTHKAVTLVNLPPRSKGVAALGFFFSGWQSRHQVNAE